ncbi:PepSY domain-containing protein [Alkalicoccus chagannorensis]|uniref:PepSY domain-containing protein n=1 Tax=Alkalicoccus chagannorensis TaxID=427072 RepID=UPI00041CDB3A|nr:PepSY domain-containing protein [Alkalicoccus chagannorensis]
MKKTIQLMMIPAATALVLAAVLLFFFQQEETMEGSTVIEAIENRYQADVTNLYLESDGYHVSFTTASGEYEALIDAVDGDVLDMEQTRVLEGEEEPAQEVLSEDEVRAIVEETVSGDVSIDTVERMGEDHAPYYRVTFQVEDRSGRMELDAFNGSIDLFTLEEETPLEPLSEEEAVAIALEEHEGEVDGVDLEEEDGRLVFEIEIENEASGVDADIILDAYTGEVLSVVFEE